MVNLQWDVMFCEKHLRPLKAKWPKGATFAMLGIFNAAVENEELTRRSNGNPDNLPLIFNSIKPVCCFLEAGKAEEVIAMAVKGKCYGQPDLPKA